VCSLFILQFCSLLHFRHSIAFGPTFSTPYTLMPRFSVSRFPPLHFWRCHVFRSRIFSRPVQNVRLPNACIYRNVSCVHVRRSSRQRCSTDADWYSLYVRITINILHITSILFHVKLRSASGSDQVSSVIIPKFLIFPKPIKSVRPSWCPPEFQNSAAQSCFICTAGGENKRFYHRDVLLT